MNRAVVVRAIAALVAGVAAIAALAVLVIAAGKGSSGALIARDVGWAVPLVAGGTVGALSWLLLAEDSGHEEPGEERVTVRCPTCGTEVLRDWRLCPYCGGSNDGVPVEPNGSTHLA